MGDGHDGYYRDIHITGAATSGGSRPTVSALISAGNSLGSERLWVNCRFTNCVQGYRLWHGNAINHWFQGCYFANNSYGLFQLSQGGCVTMDGVWFENNSIFDIEDQVGARPCAELPQQVNELRAISGIIVACTHDTDYEGLFYDNAIDYCTGLLLGNRSTSGTVTSFGQLANTTHGLHMMGNDMQNEDYLDAALAQSGGNVMHVIVEGVRLVVLPWPPA